MKQTVIFVKSFGACVGEQQKDFKQSSFILKNEVMIEILLETDGLKAEDFLRSFSWTFITHSLQFGTSVGSVATRVCSLAAKKKKRRSGSRSSCPTWHRPYEDVLGAFNAELPPKKKDQILLQLPPLLSSAEQMCH